MGSLSDYAKNKLMDHWANVAYTPVPTLYLGLCVADPTSAGTGASMNEVADTGSYARAPISFLAAASRTSVQTGSVAFPKSTASWGTITDYAIVDSATYGDGNMLAYGHFSVAPLVVLDNTPTVSTAQISIAVNATSGGAGYSDYLVHSLLNLMFRNTAFAQPDTYLALSRTVLDDQDVIDTDFTEVTGTGYARVLIDQNGGVSPTWSLASSGATANLAAITFPTVGAAGWGAFTSDVLLDSASGTGNILGYDNTNVVDQTANVGDTVELITGAFTASLS
jgi:hypothetical protein